MKTYDAEIKKAALEKMLRPGGPYPSILSKEMGIPKDTLYYWLRQSKSGDMSKNKRHKKKGPSLKEKQILVLEAKGLTDEELGVWLRTKGLHESQLKMWEQEIMRSLENIDGQSEREAGLSQENTKLKKEMLRKDKALAEMTALVILKKKLSIILGEEEDTL